MSNFPQLPHEILNETIQEFLGPIIAIKGIEHSRILINLVSITQNTMQLSQLACQLSRSQIDSNPSDESESLHTYGHNLEECIILGYESLLENLESKYPGIGQDFLVISKKIKEIIEMNQATKH